MPRPRPCRMEPLRDPELGPAHHASSQSTASSNAAGYIPRPGTPRSKHQPTPKPPPHHRPPRNQSPSPRAANTNRHHTDTPAHRHTTGPHPRARAWGPFTRLASTGAPNRAPAATTWAASPDLARTGSSIQPGRLNNGPGHPQQSPPPPPGALPPNQAQCPTANPGAMSNQTSRERDPRSNRAASTTDPVTRSSPHHRPQVPSRRTRRSAPTANPGAMSNRRPVRSRPGTNRAPPATPTDACGRHPRARHPPPHLRHIPADAPRNTGHQAAPNALTTDPDPSSTWPPAQSVSDGIGGESCCEAQLLRSRGRKVRTPRPSV